MSEHNSIIIKHMYKAEIHSLLFKYLKNLLPRAFDKMFIQKLFHMKTKSSSDVVTSFCRSTVIQQSLTFIRLKVRNNSFFIIRDSKKISFQIKIKPIPFEYDNSNRLLSYVILCI